MEASFPALFVQSCTNISIPDCTNIVRITYFSLGKYFTLVKVNIRKYFHVLVYWYVHSVVGKMHILSLFNIFYLPHILHSVYILLSYAYSLHLKSIPAVPMSTLYLCEGTTPSKRKSSRPMTRGYRVDETGLRLGGGRGSHCAPHLSHLHLNQ